MAARVEASTAGQRRRLINYIADSMRQTVGGIPIIVHRPITRASNEINQPESVSRNHVPCTP
jgi:hypothetical protein